MTITKSVAVKARRIHKKHPEVSMGEAVKEVYAEEKGKPHSHKPHHMKKKEEMPKKHKTEKQAKAQEEFKKAVVYAKKMIKIGNHKTIGDGVKEYFYQKKHKK